VRPNWLYPNGVKRGEGERGTVMAGESLPGKRGPSRLGPAGRRNREEQVT